MVEVGKKNDTKNLTIAITKEEEDKIQDLISHLGQNSIRKVKRSDVLRYLVNRYHYLVKSGHMEEIFAATERIIDTHAEKQERIEN